MDLCLNLLTQNTALHLYKMPKCSQILKHIGGPWYSPNPDNAPLLTPNRKGTKTTLCTLATKVSEKGPYIEAFPELPKGAPSWDSRVQTVPKQKQWVSRFDWTLCLM
jgi:hypothetical protein